MRRSSETPLRPEWLAGDDRTGILARLARVRLARRRDFRGLGAAVFAWYQFSREGNSLGLRRSYWRRPAHLNTCNLPLAPGFSRVSAPEK